MKSNPAKTAYAVGDTLDLTGAQMTATTISETTEDVNITSSMVSGFDSTTAGTKTVTVTYRNHTTSFDVTVAPQNECTLDLETSTTDIKDSKELDQNYNLTVTPFTSASGAVTKVKLSWEINDINAMRIDNKVWDTTELKWVVENLVLDSVHVNGAVCTTGGSFGILVGSAVCTEIKNVTVKNSSVTGGKYTGGIVGYAYTSVNGCTVENSTVSCQYKCGGIVGYICDENGGTADVKNNTVKNVTINCANLLEGKTHYETGKVVGNYNASGACSGNTVTNVTIVNGSAGYTDNEIGAIG